MTAPADDCGVAAGCGACPLGRAGVCGDPVPGGVQLTIEQALAEAADTYVDEALARIDRELADGTPPEPTPEEVADVRSFRDPHLSGLACDTHNCKPIPGAGSWRGWTAYQAGCYLCQMGDPHDVHQTAAQWFGLPGADPDAPDVDPAEPKPADAGCCGGGCGG